MDADLLLLNLSSDSEDDNCARAQKLQQTEEQFQEQKALWKPIIYPSRSQQQKKMCPPSPPSTKEAALALKTAAEALYYKRDYAGALALAVTALGGPGTQLVHSLDKKELVALQDTCRRRLASLNTV